MKKIILTTILVVIGLITYCQTGNGVTGNYKEGDFSNKTVKVQMLDLGNGWTVATGQTGILNFYKNGVVKYALGPSASMTGNSYIRDTVIINSGSTRRAKYMSGITSADYVVVSPKAGTISTRPIADDVVNWYAVTDSLIFQRSVTASSTIQVYSFIRLK